MLDPKGICKITEFGNAQHVDDVYDEVARSAMRGSIHWNTPEVAMNQGNVYSGKIDVWSLGCVVLEMWSDQPSWSGEDVLIVSPEVCEERHDTPIAPPCLIFRLSLVN